MATTGWKERARRPRIATASDLARSLTNVRDHSRPPYQFTADAPCHGSKNPGAGDSFHFGDHPQGGLVLGCWQCKGGADMVQRIEDLWGVGIQVRWPNGRLRYTFGAQEQLYAPPYALPGDTPPPIGHKRDSSSVRYHATAGPTRFTLQDLKDAPVWFAGKGKAAWQHEVKGKAYGFRHSLAPEDGGMAVARFGGEGQWNRPDGARVPIMVYPWMPLADLEGRIARRPDADHLRPCLSLAGTPELPHPLDVLVIDLDYAPSEDTQGRGNRFRAQLRAQLSGAGAPMFSSSSGNGWHALVRMDDAFLETARIDGTDSRFPLDRKLKIGNSAVAEIFPAGARRHVVIRWGHPLANGRPECTIPVVSRDFLMEQLERARRESGDAADAPAADAPTEWALWANTWLTDWLDDEPPGEQASQPPLAL